MHDRRAIREQRDAGGSIRGIARDVGASRNAVRRALAPGARDRYHRRSSTEDVELAVREVLADYPLLTVEEIGQLVEWRRSRRTLSNLVARLRPEYLERAQEDQPRAAVGTLGVGTMHVGTMAVGRAIT
jgi:transposase